MAPIHAPRHPCAAMRATRFNVVGRKKTRKVTDGRRPRPRPQRIQVPVVVLVRVFLLGSVAVIGALWALWRHCTMPRAPMVVPVTAPAPTEIEIETLPE